MPQMIVKWRGLPGEGRADIVLPEGAELEDVLLGLEDALRSMGLRVPLMSLRVDPLADGEDE